MLIQFMGCSTPDDEESKIVTVKLFLNHGDHSGRNLKTNIALTEGIGTELIGVIPSEQGFNQNYIDESNVTNWSLTELEKNIIVGSALNAKFTRPAWNPISGINDTNRKSPPASENLTIVVITLSR